MGRGFGLLHQFQDDGLLQLTNPLLDWWLCLFPGGTNWDSIEEEPVFAMIGHVFPSHHGQLPGRKLRAWEMASRVARRIEAWDKIARMDRVTAARAVNRSILLAAKDLLDQRREDPSLATRH